MNKYILHTIKKYIPIFSILFIFLIVMFSLTITTTTSYIYKQTSIGDTKYHGSSHLTVLEMYTIGLLIFCMVAPIFANTYRYSLKQADFYNQTGKSTKTFRYINNIVLLVGILAIYTFMISLFTLFSYIRDVNNLSLSTSTTTSTRTYFVPEYGYFYLSYLLIALISIGNYAFSYFLVTRSNNFINSILTLICGHIALIFLFSCPIQYIQVLSRTAFQNGKFANNLTLGIHLFGGFGSPTRLVFDFIGRYMHPEVIRFKPKYNTATLVLAILNTLSFVAVSVLSVVCFFKEKESGGDLAGSVKGRGKLQDILYYIAISKLMLRAGAASQMLSNKPYNLHVFIIIFLSGALVTFYVTNSIKNRNFKINKSNIKIYLSFSSIFVGSFLLEYLSAVIVHSVNNV